MPQKINPKIISLTFGVLVLLFVVGFYVYAWTEPGAPPPDPNVDAPINRGLTPQTKTGNLTLPNLYLNAVGNEGSVYNANIVQGYNDLIIYSNSSKNTPIYLEGNPVVINNDAGTGNVGIGIQNPGDNLHIFTNTTQTTPQIFIEQDGISGDAAIEMGIIGDSYIMGIDNSDSDKFKISYSSIQGFASLGSSDRLTIDFSGNVGIGDNSPLSLLTVGSGDRFQVNSSGDIIRIKSLTYSWPSAQITGVLTNDGTGGLTWAAASGGNPGGSDGQVQYNNGGVFGGASSLYYDDVNNRIGIGTSNPSSLLEISGGETKITRAFTQGYALNVSGRSYFNPGAVGNAATVSIGGITTDTTALYAETSGVGVHAKSTYSISPGLDYGAAIKGEAVTGRAGWFDLTGNGIAILSAFDNGVEVFTIDDGGNIGIGINNPAAKLSIGGIGSAGDAIAAYANSANSALYAEQLGSGYAGYFSGKAYVSTNLTVGGLTSCLNVKTDATGLLQCNSTSYLTSETDPQVGTLTNGKWCTSDGSAVNCASDYPGIPSGMIAMFDASCPFGWSRFAALDNRVPRGSSVYGTIGGSETHYHDLDPTVYNRPAPGGLYVPHQLGRTLTSSSWPPYLTVIWCKKD
ncbi:MAG: hypothetical protein ABIG40_01150 [Parcubacteria group bacterium]